MKQEQVIQRLRDILGQRHYAWNTEGTYVGWAGRYMGFLKSGDGGGAGSSEEKFERFLTMLAKGGCAASTQNQAFNAIKFLYEHVLKQPLGDVKALRARVGSRVRVAPSREAVRALLGDVQDVHGYATRLVVHLLYGCGLRVTEPLNLRVKDVDFVHSRLVIREAKRNKDRVVALPCSLVAGLQEQVRIARRFWELDRERGVPVAMPGLLGKKYPRSGHSWEWYWVFPSARYCEHPRRPGVMVRYRMHEANVQKAVRDSVARLGLGVLTPHYLRHAYATHVLEDGANIKAVQSAMGHEDMETTAGYVHADGLNVRSPLEGIRNLACGGAL